MTYSPPSNSPYWIRSSLACSAVTLMLALGTSGCGAVINAVSGNPVTAVPEAGREVLAKRGDTVQQIRLTRGANVAGIELQRGSVVTVEGDDYTILTSKATKVGSVPIPGGSEVELKRELDPFFFGDKYNWTGVVRLGGNQTYGSFRALKGDRAVFAGQTFGGSVLRQIQLGEPRELEGKERSSGTLVDFAGDGKIEGIYSPEMQQIAAANQAAAREKRARKIDRCKEVCSPISNGSENLKCRSRCEGS